MLATSSTGARIRKSHAKERSAVVADIVGTSRLIALHKHLVRVCVTFLLGMYAGALWASNASNVVTTEHMSAQLVAEHQKLTPGKTSSIALKLNHHPQWHSYWRTPGDSGLPTQIKWNVPEGIQMGAIQWPAPKRLPFGPLMNFGYEGETWLISDITLPPDFVNPSVTLSGHVEWLVCYDVCIPEEGQLTLTLPVGLPGTSPIANPEAVRGFETVRTLLPKKANDWSFSAVSTSTGSTLSIAPPQGQSFPQSVSFFPYDEGVIEPSAVQTLSYDDAGYQLSMTRAVQPVAPLVRLRGIVVTENGTGSPEALEIDIPVQGAERDHRYKRSTGVDCCGVAGFFRRDTAQPDALRLSDPLDEGIRICSRSRSIQIAPKWPVLLNRRRHFVLAACDCADGITICWA
jgi:DsbC/DsbD-like thiol-disulfide interchange protein